MKKKTPVWAWKAYQHRRPTGPELEGMFASNATGLAAITGEMSNGLVIRDFDDEEEYFQWACRNPSFAKTLPTIETRRGFNVCFRGPLGFAEVGYGEYRGSSKHITLLPPSLHPTGIVYKWHIFPGSSIPRLDDPWAAGLLPPGTKLKHSSTKLKHSSSSPSTILDTTKINYGLNSLPRREQIAIQESLPQREGERNRSILRLVRRLLRVKDLDRSPQHLLEIIMVWHSLSVPVIRTRDPEPTVREFFAAFESYSPDGSLIDSILQQAESLVLPPAVLARCHSDKEERLARICAALQRYWGQRPFFLSERYAAPIVGLSKTGVRGALMRLRDRGVLTRVQKGTFERMNASLWVLGEVWGLPC